MIPPGSITALLPEPVAYEPYEFFSMRLLLALVIGWYVLRPTLVGVRLNRPVGIARFVNLSFLAKPKVGITLRCLGGVLLLPYALGFSMAFVTSSLLVICLLFGAFQNSQGAANHQRQVLSLILLVQSCFYVVYSPFFMFGRQPDQGSLVIFWSQQAIVAVYLTAAITKLGRSGLSWITQSPLIALQLIKSSEQRFHNTLDDSHRPRIDDLARLILKHPGITRGLLFGGLFIELIAPLMLYGREWALIGGLVFISFHQFLRRSLLVEFPELEWTVVIFLINPVFWVVRFGT